jgi:hypothetical protein
VYQARLAQSEEEATSLPPTNTSLPFSAGSTFPLYATPMHNPLVDIIQVPQSSSSHQTRAAGVSDTLPDSPAIHHNSRSLDGPILLALVKATMTGDVKSLDPFLHLRAVQHFAAGISAEKLWLKENCNTSNNPYPMANP